MNYRMCIGAQVCKYKPVLLYYVSVMLIFIITDINDFVINASIAFDVLVFMP